MKIPAIKKLIESFSIIELMEAETKILNEEKPAIEVEGNDEGEQLTHIIASIWIMEEMKNKNSEFKDALREYTKMVRESIN